MYLLIDVWMRYFDFIYHLYVSIVLFLLSVCFFKMLLNIDKFYGISSKILGNKHVANENIVKIFINKINY